MARCHPFLPSPSPVIRDDDYEVVVVDTISSCPSSPTTEEAFLNTDPNIGADFVSKPTFSNPDLPCSANEKTCQDSDSFGNFRGSECSPNSNNTMLSNDFETIVCDSKFGRHPALLYRSIRFKGKIIEFIYNDKSRDGQTLYYVCAECQKLRRKIGPKLGPVARVRVVGGKFKDDPDRPRNPHYCNLKTIGEAMAVRVRYRMYKKIQDDVQRYESYSDSANVRNENVDAEKTSYEATVAETKYGRHPALLYRSVLHPGKVVEFVFSDKGNDGKTMYYVCAACLKLRRRDRRYGPPPRVRVINGRFRDNPDKPKVDHFCDFKTVAEALGQRERYRLYQSVRKTPKRPKLAFLDAVDEIYDRYGK
ncbi:hypothetical protein AB6A40_007531 [Gnathostoma spinigerum]|uniref:Uncharacterized protein n=1 Tax=Gnathostoma spinigerum TaxID=75299 RepID=A0ABD6EVW0_9BILA